MYLYIVVYRLLCSAYQCWYGSTKSSYYTVILSMYCYQYWLYMDAVRGSSTSVYMYLVVYRLLCSAYQCWYGSTKSTYYTVILSIYCYYQYWLYTGCSTWIQY
jgi:hypothetical protein